MHVRVNAIACLLLLLSLTPARADDGLPERWVRLAQTADAVVVGVCESAQSAWDDQHRIVTTVQFRVTRHFKGAAGDTVTVKLLGGRVGAEGMIASHAATLAAGEEAALFLRRSQFGPYYVVSGGVEGKLPVSVEAVTGKRMIRGLMSVDDFGRWIDRAAATP